MNCVMGMSTLGSQVVCVQCGDDCDCVVCSHQTHTGVAGIMYVDPEDLDTVASMRRVECEGCDMVYRAGEGWVAE